MREWRSQGNGHIENAAAFAAEICDFSAALALLNILYRERGQLGPAQSAVHPIDQ
jgi:hypothetical protein